MSFRRVFLDWRRSALVAAVDFLLHGYRRAAVWDLDRVAVVLPGGRAGRRLREILLKRAEAEDLVLFPPRITTVGHLPELLYDRKRPFASPLVQQLAWATALRQTAPDTVSRFLTEIPQHAADPQWLEVGSLLWRQHRELAGDGLDFQQVARGGSALDGFRDSARWTALSKVQQRYLQILDEQGLWDRQTARIYAIQHDQCQSDADIVLVGAVDMNRALRQMLDRVQQRVTALIHADPRLAERFDRYGCLRPEHWQESTIRLEDQAIQQVDGPEEQGRAVVHWLLESQGDYATDQITVGVPDESLVPLLQQHLQRAGFPSRWGPGRSVEASRPVRLLRAVVDYLQQRRFENLSELVRHPDVSLWLIGQQSWSSEILTRLDQYQQEHLTSTVEGPWSGELSETDAVRGVGHQVERLLGELRGGPRPAGTWAAAVLGILQQLYGERLLDQRETRDRMILHGCETVRDALLQLESIPASLLPEVTADQAILLALGGLDDQRVPPPGDPDAVELLGWLELPLDDAPALIVTSVNEGVVPTSVNSDLFLPDTLRSQLGVDDNARRYARDAYALTVLAHTRADLRLVVGRRSWEGNPLVPSRLLLATEPDRFVGRALRLFAGTSDPSRDVSVVSDVAMQARTHAFFVPQPEPGPAVRTLSVTDFKSYLTCPYRFYLSRVLGLESLTDDVRELDALAFGNLLHRVLDEFGQGPQKDCDDAQEVADTLVQRLNVRARTGFGEQLPPALQVQLSQLEQRLRAFAQRQALWRREGWRIVRTEVQLTTDKTPWDQEEIPIRLRGRIDRIDRHEGTGRWMILDYKSSDKGDPPEKSHHGRPQNRTLQPSDWTDLQLPLYRYLVEEGPGSIQGAVDLGYVVLPRDTDHTAFLPAKWGPQELRTADEAACQVARRIHEGCFWPPALVDAYMDDPLSRICQESVFQRRLQQTPTEDSR